MNYNPQPQYGTDAFGRVPGAVGLPDPSADLARVLPNLGTATGAASDAVLSKLRGELSPATINSIHDAAARFGVTSGMPGFAPGSLTANRGVRDIGLATEAEEQQGLQDFNALTGNVSATQAVRPETQIQLAEQNALNAAAPNPAAAQSFAASLFDKYLNMLRGGGTSGRGVGGGRSVGPSGGGTSRSGELIPGDPNLTPVGARGTANEGSTWMDTLGGIISPFGTDSSNPVSWMDDPNNFGRITPASPEEWATSFG
jgi:hypothetical protein